MSIICSLPVCISALLIAAHFYRGGLVVMALFCLLIPFLLLLRNRWIPQIISLFLLLASAEWARTLLALIDSYSAMGLAYHRLTFILASVIVFTLLSAAVFRSKAMKKRYANTEDDSMRR